MGESVRGVRMLGWNMEPGRRCWKCIQGEHDPMKEDLTWLVRNGHRVPPMVNVFLKGEEDE